MDLKLILLIAAAVLLVLGGLTFLLWRHTTKEVRAVMERINHLPLRSRFSLARALLQDQRVPLMTRAIIPLLVIYLALPVDLVPDFIPVLGQLDDVLVALAAVSLMLRSVPRTVLEEHIARLEIEAASQARPAGVEQRRLT